MLKFIGVGSAFNVKMGNNSAFLKDKSNKEIIMLDCGSSVFHDVIKSRLLEGINKVNVIITHLHPDHVGSLGDLIFYNYYIKGIITNVYYPNNDIVQLLDLMDVDREFYKHISNYEYCVMGHSIKAKLQAHRRKQKAYGYFIKKNNKCIFYSGDSKTIDEEALIMLKNNKLDMLYQDVSTHDYEGNPHLSFNELLKQIPEDKRDRVVCMHLGSDFDDTLANKEGFKVAMRNI